MNIYEMTDIGKQFIRHQLLVKDTTLLRQVGKSFGGSSVYKAREMDTGKIVAIKVVEFSDDADKAVHSKEGEISYALSHQNIVRVHRYYKCENCLILHMEYLRGCTLRDYVLRNEELDISIVQVIFNGIRRAVEYLHSKNITHGDIHHGNVMVDENGGAKLIGFGSAQRHSRSSTSLDDYKLNDFVRMRRLEDVVIQFI